MRLSIDRLLEIARDGTENQLAPGERAEFDRFMRRARVRRTSAPSVADPPKTVAKPSETNFVSRGHGHSKPASGKLRWQWAAVASALAAATVVAVFAIGRALDADLSAAHATAERDAAVARITRLEADLETLRGRLENSQPKSEHALRLTANKANTPLYWARTLDNHFRWNLTPEENLTQLETVSEAVRNAAAARRREKPTATAKEILDEIFEAWGKPNP